jgi:hypothetical protein
MYSSQKYSYQDCLGHVYYNCNYVFLLYFLILAPNPSDADAFKTILDHEVKKVQNKLEEFGELLKRLKVHVLFMSPPYIEWSKHAHFSALILKSFFLFYCLLYC